MGAKTVHHEREIESNTRESEREKALKCETKF